MGYLEIKECKSISKEYIEKIKENYTDSDIITSYDDEDDDDDDE